MATTEPTEIPLPEYIARDRIIAKLFSRFPQVRLDGKTPFCIITEPRMVCYRCSIDFPERTKHQTHCPQCRFDILSDKKKALVQKLSKREKSYGFKQCPICLRDFELDSPRKNYCGQCRREIASARKSESFANYMENVHD